MNNNLSRYAELLVRHGLNVQQNQVVHLSAEPIHRDFVTLIAEHAYKAGAKLVEVTLADPRIGLTRFMHSAHENLSFVPDSLSAKYDNLVELEAANLKIVGSEYPDILREVEPAHVNLTRVSTYGALKKFYEEGIGKSKVHWTVAAASTPAWAKKVFPELSASEAHNALWKELFRITRSDKENCLELWKSHNEVLHKRAGSLNDMSIKELHFQGPGTDLKVGLSPQALFKGGGELSSRNVEFEPNIPTEEVFTTPDYRKTEGKVKTTRPFLINGVLVENLELIFQQGRITSFSASSGEKTFREYIGSDEGAQRLGEVALVGIDSPIFQSGRVFQEILLDENAACHIAVGSAYKFCIEGGTEMDRNALDEIGCNESSAHTDMMISDETTKVTALLYDETTKVLIDKGCWVL